LSKSSHYANAEILHVDLTDGSFRKEPIPTELYEKYIGGRGLGVKLLFDSLAPGIDPLSLSPNLLKRVQYLILMPEAILPLSYDEQDLRQLSFTESRQLRFIFGLMMTNWSYVTHQSTGGRTLL
jgi:hypothetical protein